MVDIMYVEPHFQVFVKCINDSLPETFIPENWVIKNRWYRLLGSTMALNCSEGSVIISEGGRRPIKPNLNHWSFKGSRFMVSPAIGAICLN